MKALPCALLAGAMFYFAYGLDDAWALAWLAPLPLLWLAYGDTAAWKVAAAAFLAHAAGMVYLFQAYGTYLLVSATAMLLGNSALFALAVLLARAAWRRLPPAVAVFAFPACWTAMEFLVGWISPHGAWGAFGYTQVAWPAAIQLAAITGVQGISFLLCLFANAAAMALRGRPRAGLLGIGLCAAVVAGGYARLALPQGDTIRVAALAGDGPSRNADPAAALAVARTYADAIRAEAAAGAKVLVTPETGIERDALAPVAEAAARTGSLVVAGTRQRDPQRNMAVAFAPGRPPQAYVKRHLLLPGEGIYAPGTQAGIIGDGMAMAICKDLDFPRTIRSDARHGIRLLLVPANDFVRDDWMHARQAVMRGVENGFAVVRTAFQGLETVTDARGNVLARARVDGATPMTTIRADVPPGPGATVYTRIGDLFAWLCVGATLGLIATVTGRRRATAPGPGQGR